MLRTSFTELMAVEKYSHVLHIVSEVEGEVGGDLSAMDVFRATFPAGTMTGAFGNTAASRRQEAAPATAPAIARGISRRKTRREGLADDQRITEAT